MLDHNDGCVIFREYSKTKVRFYGVAGTSQTFSQLDVIESQNYIREENIHRRPGHDERAAAHRRQEQADVRQDSRQYTDKQLEKARAACKETENTPPQPARS
jgi:hypothetical protein